ncbi:hypothetical protein Tco_1292320 [Tanacetum coccineum]
MPKNKGRGEIVLVCVQDDQDLRRISYIAVDMSAVGPEEQILNQPDNIPDDVDTENQDEETATMIEEPASGMLIFPTVLMQIVDDVLNYLVLAVLTT